MSPFEQKVALQAFRAFLAGRGLNETGLTLPEGFEAILGFYETVRASDCTSEDADMLLFHWGTYDRAFLPRGGGTGVFFDIGLLRQLIPDVQSDDDDIWQLELNFAFEPRTGSEPWAGITGGATRCRSSVNSETMCLCPSPSRSAAASTFASECSNISALADARRVQFPLSPDAQISALAC